MFSQVCPSTPGGGGGGTPSPSYNTSKGPMPFRRGGTLGYPNPGMDPGVPPATSGWGGGRVPQDRVHPSPQLGYSPGLDNRRSTCYAVGGMPLAFTQEDFLVSFDFIARAV